MCSVAADLKRWRLKASMPLPDTQPADQCRKSEVSYVGRKKKCEIISPLYPTKDLVKECFGFGLPTLA